MARKKTSSFGVSSGARSFVRLLNRTNWEFLRVTAGDSLVPLGLYHISRTHQGIVPKRDGRDL